MEEERKELPQEEEKPVKSEWQRKKEGWYDKIPLSLKQLDIIVTVCWALIGLTVIAIILEAAGVVKFFG